MPCSPRRANSSCHRRCRLDGGSSGWTDFATDSLAPATGVGTTRFCRTHSAVRLARRASLTDQEIHPAITLRADAVASTASHPASVTIAKRPSLGWDAPGYKDDLPDRQSGLFLRNGLDSLNSIERLIKFRCSERPPHGPQYTTDDVLSASSRHCVSALGRLYPRLGDRDSAAWIACQMREGVAGMSRCRTPSRVSAFITAFMIVAGAAIAPA
jgi:hypothetical protein